MALLHQIQGATELEPRAHPPQLKIPLERPLGEVFADSSKPAVYDYPEGAAYDFSAAAPAPVYGQAGLAYGPGSDAAAAFGAGGLGGFPPLSSVSPSSLVLLHPPPPLSPFLHPHGQQVPYYLDPEPSGYAVREPGPPAFYRYPRPSGWRSRARRARASEGGQGGGKGGGTAQPGGGSRSAGGDLRARAQPGPAVIGGSCAGESKPLARELKHLF